MKVLKEYPKFPLIRRHYKSYKEIGDLLGRSVSYVNNRLNGRGEFTRPEKYLICSDMGLTLDQVFGSRPEVVDGRPTF